MFGILFTARLPKTAGHRQQTKTADHFKTTIAEVENAYENLANAHHIALAPGSYSIWMAHPFSGLPTNYVAKVGSKRFWGN